MLNSVLGHIAMWATRQSPYFAPERLTEVLADFQSNVKQDSACVIKLGCYWLKLDSEHPEKHLRKILYEHLLSIPQVRIWNERKNGNQSPYGFCSRYDKPNPDNDFIDLDALVGNIARSCMVEYRQDLDSYARISKSMRWWTLNNLISRLRYKFIKPNKPELPMPTESNLGKTACVFIASVLASASLAQQTAFITNSLAWDASPSPNISLYVVTLTTNKVAMGTNGYVPPASAIIQTDTTTTTQISITNLWPAITNGTYSVFVQARNTAGVDSITSSNLVFNMVIPPLPVRNLRLQ